MKILQIKIEPDRVSASIDGFDLWYKIAGAPHTPDVGSAILCSVLLPAMRSRQDIQIDHPVSPQLLGNISELQEIFSCWYGLSKVRIEACNQSSARIAENGVGCFFSGGVDSTYSFLSNRNTVTHLICIRGADMEVDSPLWSEVLAANQRFADEFGVKLITIETNVRKMVNAFGSNWPEAHGGALAGIAHLVGFGRTLIAASHCYDELLPWGSHIVTDRLWSTETSQLIHDGVARRSEKIRFIGREPMALRGLRVCWQDKTYNCGVCNKCLRTRISLRLLKLKSDSLKSLDSAAELKSTKIEDRGDFTFFADNLCLAKSVGDREIAVVLRKEMCSWVKRRALREFYARIARGALGKAKRPLKWVLRR